MATKLGFRRFLATILAAAGLAAGQTAKAGGNWMPLLPDQDFYDFQLFAPPDLDEYGIYQEAHDGMEERVHNAQLEPMELRRAAASSETS